MDEGILFWPFRLWPVLVSFVQAFASDFLAVSVETAQESKLAKRW